MKAKTFAFGLMLALTLILLIPAEIQAMKPVEFNAQGTINSISNPPDAVVIPAGESLRWMVLERDIIGSISGDIEGDFTITYKANVDLSQAGIFQGMLIVDEGSYEIEMNGKSQPFEIVGSITNPYPPPTSIPILRITISGNWNFISGARGQGEFEASFDFIPTPDNHIAYIVDSEFTLTGMWQPPDTT